ncbi:MULTISPECIES: hypothetical protein [unclassified Microcoleus]|uniref:hypothetical protein n=1 Tax=unclassified Microcoleus TaxID=2642155 RepID=UPI002FD00C29
MSLYSFVNTNFSAIESHHPITQSPISPHLYPRPQAVTAITPFSPSFSVREPVQTDKLRSPLTKAKLALRSREC